MSHTTVILYPTPANLPRLVRLARERRRLPLQVVADALHLDKSRLARLERGEWRQLDVAVARQLARILGEPEIARLALMATLQAVHLWPEEAA